MKVVILGGYGVFGSRLAVLLVRDGHDIWIAGRRLERACAIAKDVGAEALEVDFLDDPSPIFHLAPDVVIDAAGPFQAYGADPYRIPRLCIRYGVDYFDLADDAEFATGIGQLDAEARRAGRRVLSGASSVPGLSSVVVGELARGFDELCLIDEAILPGNKAPRGVSVMASIVGQVGVASPVWRGGMWRHLRCWTDHRSIRLRGDVIRSAYFINVPDVQLFPSLFRARSVMFRAGMELWVMNAGLVVLGAVRRIWPLPATPLMIGLLQRLADLLLPFGTDRGGMRVAVTGLIGKRMRERTWLLVAEAGEGPFVPCIVVRALLRQIDKIEPGARPCLCEATFEDIENAVSDLALSIEVTEMDRPSLFQSALADRWPLLPKELQKLHDVQDVESFSGVAHITCGRSVIARLIAWLVGFPTAGDGVPVTVTKTRTETGELWERDFAGRIFRSFCQPASEVYHYRERLWPLLIELSLEVAHESLHLRVRRGWFLGLPMPQFLLPKSNSREYVQGSKFHFDVALSAPLGLGLIVHYQGSLIPDRADQPPDHDVTRPLTVRGSL